MCLETHRRGYWIVVTHSTARVCSQQRKKCNVLFCFKNYKKFNLPSSFQVTLGLRLLPITCINASSSAKVHLVFDIFDLLIFFNHFSRPTTNVTSGGLGDTQTQTHRHEGFLQRYTSNTIVIKLNNKIQVSKKTFMRTTFSISILRNLYLLPST